MKRSFLWWLDSLPHKPQFLKSRIRMALWGDLCHIQRKKKQHQTKLDKKLKAFEEKIQGNLSILKRGYLLEGCENYNLKQTKTKLTPVAANKKIIEIMKKDGYSEAEIHERLSFLGLELTKEQRERVQEDIEKFYPKEEKPNGKSTDTAKPLSST